jgi:hypothetical protein
MNDKVREWVYKEFRAPADQVKVLRGKFEEQGKKFHGATHQVREACPKLIHGGVPLQTMRRYCPPLGAC